MLSKLLLDGIGKVTLRQFLWLSLGNSILKLTLLLLQIAVSTTIVGVLCHKVGYCNFPIEALPFVVAAWFLFVITACFNVPVVGSIAYFLVATLLLQHVSLSWANWLIYPLGGLALVVADIRQMNLFHAFSLQYTRPMWFRVIPVAAFILSLSLLASGFLNTLFGVSVLNAQVLISTAAIMAVFMLYILLFPKKKASHA